MKPRISLLLLFTLIFFLPTGLSAQNKPVTFGIKAGMNWSNSSISVDDGFDDLSSKHTKKGFQLGVTVDLRVSRSFYFLSGLSYTAKGVIVSEENSPMHSGNPNTRRDRDLKINLPYLQLPLMLAYKVQIMPSTRLVLSAGPYLACGIGGKMKFNSIVTNGGWWEDEDLDSFGERSFRRFDYGLAIGAGLEVRNFCLYFNYEWGGQNCNRDSYDSDIFMIFHREYKNRNASLTLGYKFWK